MKPYGWARLPCFCLIYACSLTEATAQPAAIPAEPPAEHREKLSIPSADARRQSLARVKDVFRDDFAAATTLPKKRELSRRLYEQAEASENPADRWTLLVEALRLATEAADADLVVEALGAAKNHFAPTDPGWQIEILARIAPKATPESGPKLAVACLDAAKLSSAAGQDDVALKAVGVALGIARKTRDEDLLARVTRFQQSIKERQRLEKELEPLLKKLEEFPSDREANTLAGIALCLKADRWDEGLPKLAKGNDESLAAIARIEIASPNNSGQRVLLGDKWWDWADGQKQPLQMLGESRAVYHYALAVNDLQGLDRVRLEKRIQGVQRQSGGTGETVFLADLPEKKVSNNLDFTKGGVVYGVPFKVMGKEYPKALSAVPKSISASSIEYVIPAGGRRCRGKVGLFRPAHAKPGEQPRDPFVFEIAVDGETIWKSPPLKNLDDTAAFDVNLGSSRTVELLTRAVGSNSYGWAAWLDPVIVK
jgi:hypothetical protein